MQNLQFICAAEYVKYVVADWIIITYLGGAESKISFFALIHHMVNVGNEAWSGRGPDNPFLPASGTKSFRK